VIFDPKSSPAARPLRDVHAGIIARQFRGALEQCDGLRGAHCIHELWMRNDLSFNVESAIENLWTRAAAAVPEWLPMRYVDWLPVAYEVSFGGTTYQLAGTHGPSGISGDTGNPKDRVVFTLTYAKGPGPLTVSSTVNYTSHFNITDPSAGIADCLTALTYDGRFSSPTAPPPGGCTVHTWVEANLYTSWAVTDQLVVHAAVTNAFNRQPPIDYQTYGGGGYAYDASLHEEGAIGRFYLIGAAYKFK
jgi:hypothetical protein